MPPNPFIAGRIPPKLNSQIEAYCERTGKAKTELLIEALCAYLDISPEEIMPPARRTEQERLADIERRLVILEANSPRADNSLDNGADGTLEFEPEILLPLTAKQGLTARLLAQRLKTSEGSLRRVRDGETFPDWSRKRDPQTIAWRWDSGQRLFFMKNVSADSVEI